mmetsp:Transcript_13124/g.24789  ORF Transcript_13124/g.24789 Transcript_13124/m.24789 type:complete len:99 (+) Transcript_13124:62-358(+)
MRGLLLALCAGVATASGALPPWWILNNIKPEGEPQSMGSYTVITFSKAQQDKFAINSHGEPKDRAKFTAALKALKEEKVSAHQKAEVPRPSAAPPLLV